MRFARRDSQNRRVALAEDLLPASRVRAFVCVLVAGCAPAITATPQPAGASGAGRSGFTLFAEGPVASFAAGRGAQAPKATGGKIEDDEAIHIGGYIGGSLGLTDTVDGEAFVTFAAPFFPNGGGLGARAQLVASAWDVGVAFRAGGMIGTGGSAYDSASDFDGDIPQPLAKVGYAQATITANRARGSIVPLVSLSALPAYVARTVDGDPSGTRAATSEHYIGVVTTATVALYVAARLYEHHRLLIGPIAALAMFAMPERDGGVGWVPSLGLSIAITPR